MSKVSHKLTTILEINHYVDMPTERKQTNTTHTHTYIVFFLLTGFPFFFKSVNKKIKVSNK